MDFSPLQAYLDQMIEKGVPGCELAVSRDHEILFHACAGYSDAEHTRPAVPEDRYFLYSCTKPVTVTAAMRCLQDGIFSLDDEVSRYLPAYADAFLPDNGARRAPKTPITVRHLMTMSAGLDYNWNSPVIRDALTETCGHATTRQLAETFAKKPLCFEPGARFQYSLCHDVLAAVIEAASGIPFGAFVQAHILDPLGMEDTDFYLDGKPNPRLAALYSYDSQTGKVILQKPKNAHIPTGHYFSGGAGLVSTVTDYLKFADALACGGGSVLKRETIDRMRTPQMDYFDAGTQFTCTCGDDYGYGLGVRTRVAFRHGHASAIGEFGWDGAAGADLLIDPEHHISMVYAQHVLGWPDMLGCVHNQIRDLLYPIFGL